jgi:Fe-Mn family superoxide dismutase
MMNTPTAQSAAAPPAFPVVGASADAGIELPPLPYEFAALEPVISANTLRIHYCKHHQGYVDALNKLILGTSFAGMSLEQIVMTSARAKEHEQVFHNAAQAWNHTFYWHSLKPSGGGEPVGPLATLIKSSFGNTASLKRELAKVATSQFGSGWAWLVLAGDRLKVESTANAGNVMTEGLVPLLVIDVWEHAYYLDFQNRRPDYITGVLDKLLNWDFAAGNLGRAIPQRASGLI